MKQPQVSVILPVFNAEQYVGKSIHSILSQSFYDLELIIVDDCSTDKTFDLCREMASKDVRVALHRLEQNSGPSVARNKGIDLALGEFITFVDADDWLAENFIEVLLAKARKYDGDIAVGRAVFIEKSEADHQQASPTTQAKNDVILNTEQALIDLFTSQTGIRHAPWGKIYKKSLFGKNIRYPEGLLLEDLLTTYLLVSQSTTVVLTKETDYYYHLSPQSLTRGKFKQSSLTALPLVYEIKHKLGNPSGDLAKAIEYCEYEVTRFVISNMVKDGNYLTESRKLMRDLGQRYGALIFNKYMPIKEKTLLTLMLAPPLYEKLLRLAAR